MLHGHPLPARGRTPTLRPLSGATARASSMRGFTLVELLIIVIILGILAAMAMSAIGDVSTDARLNAAQKEFEIMEVAFRSYRTLADKWPEDQIQGVTPPEIEEWLTAGAFLRKPIMGDVWDWNPDFGPVDLRPNISVYAVDADMAMWLELDERYDDGDLTTGKLRRHGGSHLCYGISQ